MVVIYKITSPTNKVYIGQTWDFDRRVNKHYKNAGLCKNQPLVSKSFIKHGRGNHRFEAIHILPDDVTQEVLDRYEGIYMDAYKEAGCLMLNVRGAGSRGKLSESTKNKLRILAKIRMTGAKRPGSGSAISASNRGRKKPPRSKEHCRKISERHKGRPSSNIKKPILQYTLTGDFIKEWECAKYVADELNRTKARIGQCCKNESPLLGFIWKYKNAS